MLLLPLLFGAVADVAVDADADADVGRPGEARPENMGDYDKSYRREGICTPISGK